MKNNLAVILGSGASLDSGEHLRVTSSNVIKYLFGFSTLTAHDVMNQSILISLLNYLDRLFSKISLH